MNAISEETIALVEDFRGRFQGMGYGDGHYILACHAAFPVAFTPDMLYQIWANFKQYPAFASLPGRYRQIDPMAVSDLLLSNLCRPAALDIFEMDNEVRAYFLYKLREDRRFGQPRVLALANFLMQYWTAKTLAQYPESFKQTIYWTALATLDPDAAARKISAALLAIREEQPSEVFRMSNLLEAFSAQQPNFGNMAAYLKGMKAALLDMPQAAQEQVGRSGAFIIQEEPGPDEPVYRMPLLRQMKGKVKIKKSVPDGKDRKPAAETQYLGEVSFDQKRGWRLNRGSIHGISTHTLLEILVDENRPIFPTIEKLEGDGSILGLDAEDQLLLDEARVYLCKTAFRLNVMLRNEEAEGLEAQIEQALGSFGGLIHLTDSEREAGYLLNVRHGLLFITLPYQHDYPLARPVPLEGEESLAIEAGAQNLSRIARWEYIKAFKNKNERLSEQGHSPIRAVVHYKVGEEWLPYAYTENGAVVDYMEWVESKRTYRSYLKVELTNESDRDLYYSFFYLTINFESSGAMMDKPSERIRAGETVTIFNHKGGILPFSIEQQILDYNQPESRVWFKVIYSEQQIDTRMLKVRQLPPPEQKQFSKGRFFELDDVGLAPGKFRNWDALSITLTFKNPQYNRVSKEHFLNLMWQPSDEGLLESTGSLEAFLWQLDERLLRQLDEEPGRHRIFEMLGGNRLVPFAAAQYLAPDGLSGRLNLRTSIALIEEGVEGTMERSDAFPGNRLLKIANTYGRTVRLTDFERRVKKYPSRPLIIAEGDAWLHHPGIKDMASHLSKRYNVYSRGAAADEMRRFWVTKEYLRVIEILEEQLAPKQVAFFMLSGGGHELLVEHFREFLNAYEGVESLPPGERPGRFLSAAFYEELEAVMKAYEQVFSQLQSRYSHIRVLAHGYDYFLPKKEGEAGGTWLGQPLTEKGILRPEDRAAILKFMVDQFNARLANVAQAYPQVTYVDLRGTLRASQWANELYPDSAGFRAIAGRLEQAIDKIRRGGSYAEPLRQRETQAAAPGIEERLAEAIDNVRAAFETEGPPSGQQLETLADSLKGLVPEMEDLHILEPLFEDGGDAALFSAAVLLEARKDASYLERLIANIDKEPLTDEVHLRLLQAVGNTLSEHTLEDEQRQDLIARLREAARQRGAEATLPFPPGTSLDMIRQICDKAEPKISYEEVFSGRQLGSAEASGAEPPRGKNYLLVIGIDQYLDFPPLGNAVKDAQEIAKVLIEKYQFEQENLITLFNSAATQSAIIEQFKRLADAATEDDTLLVYHSGHGEYDERIDVGQWIPSDARRGEIGSYISFDLIMRLLRAIKTRHTFIISDSVYSGSVFISKERVASEHMEGLPSRWMLTAGLNEVVSDGKQGENSPFARAILRHLQKNEEPRLRVSDFCDNVTVAVGNNSAQLPRFDPLQGIGHQGGEFMFRLKAYKDVAFEEPPEEKAVDIEVETKTEESKPQKEYAPMRTLDDVRKRLKNHIRENEFEETFELFDRVIDDRSSRENDINMQRSQYSNITKQIQNNLVDANFANITLNRIRYALNSVIDDLEEKDLKPWVINPLRTLDEMRNRLKIHIRESKFEAAFELLNWCIDDRSSQKNDIIMQQAQYNSITKQMRDGLVDPNFANSTLNRIRHALSAIADGLEEEDLRPGVLQPDSSEAGKSRAGNDPEELERQGLEQQAELLTRKLSYFRQELAKAYDAGQKFALEEQIGETERQLREIRQLAETRKQLAQKFEETTAKAPPPTSDSSKFETDVDRLEHLPSRWLLTAGRRELVADGRPGEHSPFAKAVIWHLENNKEPRLRVSQFCNDVVVNVGNNAEQLPRGAPLQNVGHMGGEFIFRLKGQEALLAREGGLPQGKNYIFAVGIDNYQDQKIYGFQSPVKDAEEVARILVDKYQFERENLFTLFNKQATQSAIIGQFQNLAKTVTENDTLLMYFAGHGEYNQEIDVGYWLPADARLGEIGSYLSFDLVTRLVRAIRSRHTFIISDAAYSGSFFTTHR